MYCTLYILREKGKKLPAEVVRGRGKPGWLELGPNKRLNFPRIDAWFRPDEAGVQPLTIIHAQVKFIAANGMMITGREDGFELRYEDARQAWWVVPRFDPPDQL